MLVKNNYWIHFVFRTFAVLMILGASMVTTLASGALKSQDEQSVLVQKAREGDFNAVRIIAKHLDPLENKEIVEQLAEAFRASTNPVRTRTLRKSLAMLGDSAAREEIIASIQCEDRYDQFHAIQDAADIGGDDMIVILAVDPTAPHIDLHRITYSDDDVQHWRDWWMVNGEKYVGQQ